LKEFLTVKRSILHEQISSIDNEKKRCNALVSSKQDEIQHLSEKLSSALKTCSQNDCQKDALSLMVGTLKMRNWSLKLKTRSFLAWFSFHCRQVHKKKTSKLVEKLFRKSIINFVFLPWKASWKRFSMNKAQKRFNESLEAEKVSLAMHFNKEIEMLRKRLEDAENKIHNEEEAKVAIQENLKKAFMRGVCAMNFEAMNILNPESQGFNPNVLQPSGKIDFFENLQEKKQESPQTSPMKPSSDLIDLANFPAESKELKWKAAPVFGRPQTAQVISEPLPGLPMVTSSNNTEGKVIVVNNAKTEVKITGKVPVRTAVGKKK
jgi:centrosomal protein POC5